MTILRQLLRLVATEKIEKYTQFYANIYIPQHEYYYISARISRTHYARSPLKPVLNSFTLHYNCNKISHICYSKVEPKSTKNYIAVTHIYPVLLVTDWSKQKLLRKMSFEHIKYIMVDLLECILFITNKSNEYGRI